MSLVLGSIADKLQHQTTTFFLEEYWGNNNNMICYPLNTPSTLENKNYLP